jgi:tripartite-type tricarboxylate transporter receptor subunit TctC
MHMTQLERATASKSSILAIACLAAWLAPALADPVSDFYEKNRVTISVGGTSQGGYAAYARTLAQFLGDHIPGHPTVIVQYLPGAGSVRAANYIYNIARKDGSEIGAFEMPILTMPLYESGGGQYDSEKFHWLGSLNSDVAVCYVRSDTGITTLEQAMQNEVIIGATAPSSNTASFPTVLNNLLKTHFNIVVGYNGPNLMLALWRNEVQGQCGSWGVLKGMRGDLLKTKAVNLLVQLATERDADLPDVPLVMDFVKSEEQKAALAFIFGPQKLGRPFALPPQVPAERVAAMRKAFSDVAKDPRLIAAFEKQNLGFSFVDGEQMQGIIAELFRTPKAVIEVAAKAGAITEH